MLSIGDERHAVDAPANRDLVLGQRFIADDADGCRSHAKIELGWHLPAAELLEGFDSAGDGTGDNDKHDEDPGQIFSAIVAIGVALVSNSSGKGESDPEG